jgi:hypothetical protein
MAEQSQALARFYMGFQEDGTGKDGLPLFREQLMVKLAVPPFTALDRIADPEDIETYPGAYALFEKEQRSLKAAPTPDGFPLVLWPAVNAAALQMLSARDVFTIEQLAKYASRGGGGEHMPGELRELADRAKKMVEMTREVGQFETMIRDRDGQISALKEEVIELRATIKVQDGQLNVLKARVAA